MTREKQFMSFSSQKVRMVFMDGKLSKPYSEQKRKLFFR